MRDVLIAGGSMSPTLEIGETVRVATDVRVRVGDVVVLHCFGETICHRAIAVVPGWRVCWVVHRGEAPARELGVVLRRDVVGRVVTARSPAGHVRRIERVSPSPATFARAIAWLAARALKL